MSGIERASRTATVLLRGSNKLVLEEAERSLHDALCVIRCLVHKRFLVAGGAAPEVEVATQLQRWAKTLVVRHAIPPLVLLFRTLLLQIGLYNREAFTSGDSSVLSLHSCLEVPATAVRECAVDVGP